MFRNHAVRTQRWKLVNGVELYDMENDPGESNDLSRVNPAEVLKLRQATEAWFADVSATRNGYAPPRIYIGAPEENPVLLTRQDRRDEPAGWAVDVRARAAYEITLLCHPSPEPGEAMCRLGDIERRAAVAIGATRCVFSTMTFPVGPGHLVAAIQAGNKPLEVLYVEVRKSLSSIV